MKNLIKLITLGFLAALFVVACDSDKSAGNVGESLGRTLDKTKDSLEDAGEKLDGAANDTKRAVEDISD